MATKNFKQMSTKKLNALLETASEEEKTQILEVLNTRNAASAGAGARTPEAPAKSEELSEEEKAAIEAAEAENAPKTNEKKAAPKEKAPKLTDEECAALAEKLRTEAVDHKCKVVPFNSIEWVDGIVVSIIVEKRTNKVMFAVKTDDGRRVVKAHDSQLIQILDETVERAKRTRGKKSENAEGSDEPWTDEEIEEAVKEVIGNVGKTVSYPEAGAYGQIAEDAATITGRIVSLVPAKRSKSILYRIEIDQEDENAPKKYAHKTSTLDTLQIADELDEVGQKINEAFTTRRYKEHTETKPAKNEKEAFEHATEMLEKAKLQLEKAKQLVEKRETALASAKEAYDKAIAEGKTFDEPNTEPNTEAETEEQPKNNDTDLM